MQGFHYKTGLLLLCGLLTVFLQFAHVLKMNPIHDNESAEHSQLHIDEVEHHHHNEPETLDESALTLLKIHDFMHANLGFFIGSTLIAPDFQKPVSMVQVHAESDFPSVQHPPPVPPPLA